jgi:hypothetical protein
MHEHLLKNSIARRRIAQLDMGTWISSECFGVLIRAVFGRGIITEIQFCMLPRVIDM